MLWSEINFYVLLSANREAAFFQAITAAGIVVAVTRACNKDDYHESCRCDYKYGDVPTKKYRWDGCNDNIKFGTSFAQKFLDAREIGNDARVLMNKQNNLAGRMVSQLNVSYPFNRQPYKMVKHTQTIHLQQLTHCLSVFGHFVRLAIKGL